MTGIYVCTHKAFTPPPDPIYLPVCCGAALPGRERLSFPGDDTGDNISLKNPFYSELSGMYWVWKNDRTHDILGLCHYRRYLLDRNGKLFTDASVREALKESDAITTKRIRLDSPYREAFGGKHALRDFMLLEEAVAERAGEYLTDFLRISGGKETYFGNMLICRRELFADYSAWLFDLLFAVEKNVDMTGYNDYQKRLYGFLSELLLMVYLEHNGLRVTECAVAVLGGKKETEEALETIAGYFRKGDAEGAARYFMELYRRRPDILMEASDVNGELKLAAQMIATFRAEREKTGRDHLEKERDMAVLLDRFRKLNEEVRASDGDVKTELSQTAVEIARRLR